MTTLQRQMNSAMMIRVLETTDVNLSQTFQALCLLLFMMLPLAFALVTLLARNEAMSFLLPAVTSIIAWTPALNALSMTFAIPALRETLSSILFSMRKRTTLRPFASTASWHWTFVFGSFGNQNSQLLTRVLQR